MSRPLATMAGVLVCAGAIATSASAQQRVQVAGGPTLAHLRVHHAGTGFGEETRGAAEIGFEGIVAFRRLALRLRYAQADLTSDTAVFDRDAAAAELALLGAPFPWLRIGIGTRRRSYEDTQQLAYGRWVVWEAIAATEFPIFSETVTGSGELRAALGGSLEDPEPTGDWGRGLAGDVGMRVRVPSFPLWIRLGYRIETQRLAGGTREDVVDGLTVLVGVGAR